MSKNKNSKSSKAEDYLTQVDWQNQQSQRKVRIPSRFEPKWKYKTVSLGIGQGNSNILIVTIIFILATLLIGVIFSAIIESVIAGFGLALIVTGTFYLMVRDASKKRKDGDD